MAKETATLTELRANIYQLFDQVQETGKPIYIKRKRRVYQISIMPEPNLPYSEEHDGLESNL